MRRFRLKLGFGYLSSGVIHEIEQQSEKPVEAELGIDFACLESFAGPGGFRVGVQAHHGGSVNAYIAAETPRTENPPAQPISNDFPRSESLVDTQKPS